MTDDPAPGDAAGERRTGVDAEEAPNAGIDAGRDEHPRIDLDRPCVLVPLAVLEGQTVPEAVAELLSTVPVVLLGYHDLPEQTPPDQARLQFEDRATATLDDVEAVIDGVGGTAEQRLVFTPDRDETVDRIAAEEGCAAVLLTNPTRGVERLLVSLRRGEPVRVARFVAALIGDRDIAVTLLSVARDEDAEERRRERLDAAREALAERGLPRDRIAEEVAISKTPVRTVVEAADDHDAVVTAERRRSIEEAVFGERARRIARESLAPVLVVRREQSRTRGETNDRREETNERE